MIEVNISRRNLLAVAAVGAGLIAGCSSDAASDDATTGSGSTEDTAADDAATEDDGADETAVSYPYDFVTVLSGSDELYSTASDTPGTVESLSYTCHSYAIEATDGVEDVMVEKTLYVYLPYGYDPTQQYDVLYLMHGTTENAGYWLTTDDDNKGERTCNLLDSMHDQGLCNPTIVVTPTYYSIPEDMDIDTSMTADTDGDGFSEDNDPYADEWPVYFWKELRNDIIPLVEATYPTYAGGDVSEEGLQASRDHRAFAGLSRGAVTTVASGMMHCLDYFSYIGSYSGGWADYDEFSAAVEGDFADYPVNFWYNSNGTNDFALERHQTFYEEVLEGMPDRFVDGENCSFVIFDNGAHAYSAWIIGLYNSLLAFFRA